MKIGKEYEYEKAEEITTNKLKLKSVASNNSDEEGTLAQAYTRFDNDEENPDQFDEYDQLGSDDII